MKNLESMGVQEMDASEMKDTEGGMGFLLALGCFAIGVAIGFAGKELGLWG